MRFSFLASLALATAAAASPLIFPSPPSSSSGSSDPAFVVAQSELDSKLVCPGSDKTKLSKPILLVPGTGSTGPEAFDHNYVILTRNLGYQPCYVSPPPHMLNDSQLNAEYVVNGIHRLYAASNNKKVPIVSWSQGGLITQWALTFFPSTVNQTDRVVNFAPSLHGTVFAYLLDALPTGIAPSVWQQSSFAAFITALKNASGDKAIVPTTNIYSSTDEIVQPQFTGSQLDSSYLNGASNVLVQETCGPLFIVEHSQELFNAFTYAVAKAALQSPTGKAEKGSYSAADCSEALPPGLSVADGLADATIIAQAAITIIDGPRVACEPKLQPYAAKYYPGPQACNPLAALGQAIQTPPIFDQYESLVYYILTHVN